MKRYAVQFSATRSKSIKVNSFEELINRFIKAEWLRLDLNFWNFNITIVNDQFRWWHWYESCITGDDYSWDWNYMEWFKDIIEEIQDVDWLSKEISDAFINGLMISSDYSHKRKNIL